MKALLVLIALAAPAAAEINMADSVEWQTIDADLVVRGFVAARTKTDVTVQITETLKGGAKKTIVVRSPLPVKDKADLVLFLDKDGDGFVPRESHGDDHSVLELGTHRAYTADFEVLTKPTDVLAAVRRAARSQGTTSIQLGVPWDTPAMKAMYSGSTVFLVVPIDTATEQQAIALLASQDQQRRTTGVQILARFRSPANITRMRGLLADATWVDVQESGKPKVRRYVIRKLAHEALASWQVAHTAPVLEEPSKSQP
jgi:hypothetical protein